MPAPAPPYPPSAANRKHPPKPGHSSAPKPKPPKPGPTLTNPIHPVQRIIRGRGVVVKSGGVDIGTLNVKAMQLHLKSEGYDIAVDGKLGPVTKAALADYMNPKNVGDMLAQAMKGTRFTGARNPKAFNAKLGQHPIKAFKSPSQLVDGQGNPRSAAADPSDPSGGGTVAPVGSPGFKMTPESMALMGASLLDPKMAYKIAGLGYDAQIHDLTLQQLRQPRVEAQDLADIKNWYGQALSSLGTAGVRDTAASTAGANSILDATKALVASMGGSANLGSGSVASAGADSVGTLKALGTAEDQYNDDMGPIMKMAQAGASASEHARQVTAAQDLSAQLEDLKGQRGDAKASALMSILQGNNTIKDNRVSQRLAIRGSNNQLTEQNFQNTLAEQQAELAAATLGVKMQAAAMKPPKGSYGDATPNIKNTAFNQGLSAIYNPTTKRLITSIPGAVARVNATIRGFGWSLATPDVLKFRNNILQSAGITPNPAWH